MHHLNSLQQQLDDYQAAIKKTATNREHWSTSVKELLFTHLVKIRQMADLNWVVLKIEGITNLESVRLQLEPEPSGIIIRTKTEEKNLIKYRGALIFSQAHNGDLIIMVEPPYIEELMPKPPVMVLESCNPEEVSEKSINKVTEDFIEIITEWESNTESKEPIGFKNGNHD